MDPAIFPIDQFFPSDKYKETCKANKSLVPMYLIACNQSFKLITEQIKKCETAGQQWNLHPEWKITCLHVAVWQQKLEVIQYLLKKNPLDVKAHDAINFLPIHYSEAIGNSEIITIIKSAMKTDYVSHKSIWEKLLKKPTEKKDVFFHYINEEGNIMKGDSAKFAELTEGAILTQMFFFRNRTALLENIANTLLNYQKPEYQIKIEEITKRSQSLCLKKQGAAGWGLRTLQKFDAFIPFVIYAGEGVAQTQQEKSAKSVEYLFNSFEAHRFRNLSGMINEGFPNCTLESKNTPWGICYPVIFPIRTIKEGEELFIDYSQMHDIKQMKRIEFNLDEAKTFLKTQGLSAIFEKEFVPSIIQTKQGTNEIVEKEKIALAVKIWYLLGTPSVLVRLVIEKVILLQDLKLIQKYSSINNDFLKKTNLSQYVQFFEMYETFGKLNNLDIYEEIKGFLLKLLDTHNTDIAIAAFEYVAHYLCESKIPQPHRILQFIFKDFENAIPFFQKTRSCLYQKRDINDEELATLQEIEKLDPVIKKIYHSYYFNLRHPYPNLKKFLEQLEFDENQKTKPADFEHILKVAQMLASNKESEELLNKLENDPILKASMMHLFKNLKLQK